MRRAIAVAVALVATLCSPGPAAADAAAKVVDGRIGDWVGKTSRFGGTSQYSSGEFVYQDHVYDDLGAETRQRSQQHGSTGPADGDYRYPANEKRYGSNAADLLELRFAADDKSVWILARMNTLKVRDGTVVAIAFDTDRRTSTGGGPWPHAAGIAADGADVVVTLWGTKGTITKLPNGRSRPLNSVAIDTSNSNNAVEARVPRSLFGRASRVRAWAATGLWNAGRSEWLAPKPGSPTETTPGGGSPLVSARAFNVAFRGDESGSYMEEDQAVTLAAGDITSFVADVDLAALSAHATHPYEVRPGRFYVVVMEQSFTIPPADEGMSYEGVQGRFRGAGGEALVQSFRFYGRHQPYGLYVPSSYGKKRPIPAALVLHGHGGSHSTYNSQNGFLRDMGEGGSSDLPPMFLITPLARGSSFYADWGEADTLEVLDDVLRRFPIDRERLYITGYSMGGYGVYRLASLYPDRFAAAGVWAGYTGEFTGSYLTDPRWVAGDPTGMYESVATPARSAVAPLGIGGGRAGKAVIGDPVDTLENLQHLPVVHLAGSNDPIVPTSGQFAAPRRLAQLGFRSRFDLYPGYEHLTFALVDDWMQVRRWIGNRKRVRAPREITYKFSDGWTERGLARKLGLTHGAAWWLRAVSMRKPTDDALALSTATIRSHAVRSRETAPDQVVAAAVEPAPHLQFETVRQQEDPLPTANRLDIGLDGVGEIAIDTRGAGLNVCGLSIRIQSDGATTVRFLGKVPADARVVGDRALSSDTTEEALAFELSKKTRSELRVRCSK